MTIVHRFCAKNCMWLPVSAVALVCFLLEFTDGMPPEKELDLIFHGRTRSDWQAVWHKETFKKCRESLKPHVNWACEKDIYRLMRRKKNQFHKPEFYFDYPEEDAEDDEAAEDNVPQEYPFIRISRAFSFLRRRRGSLRRSEANRSITKECCQRSPGCTWEEYAEYCPNNKRRMKSFI